MAKRRLLWQLYPSYLLITIAALLGVGLYTANTLHDFFLARTISELEAKARLIEEQVSTAFGDNRYQDLTLLCRRIDQKSSTRLTIILPSGEVVVDSREDPSRMANHANRLEIAAALKGRPGSAIRMSKTIHETMLYVAIPLRFQGEIGGVLRLSVPLTALKEIINSIYTKIILACLFVAMLTAIISLPLSRRISRPLEEMKRGIERFARGDFSRKLTITSAENQSLEVSSLADTVNRMAAQLNDRIKTVEQQRNELEAVFASMTESVVAVDSQERLMSINQAAADLLGVDPVAAKGNHILTIAEKEDLQRFVKKTLASYMPIEEELTFRDSDGTERFLQAHGTLLGNAQGKSVGALIVLNDVTRLRKLENMRQDFVANVSHELRTPITSIKGFAETLLDGAMAVPEDAARFLEIISRQAERLNSIVEDLLTLASLEQDEKSGEIPLQNSSLQEVLQNAVDSCSSRAAAKDITVILQCPPLLTARINGPLFEQAIINLLINAIKYSSEGSSVKVAAAAVGNETVVRVCDQGCGIAAEHLPRLFERFYRSDKARSRELGGTGLGLAIVKHIVKAHNGRVTIESSPGTGSTFSIHLPHS